MLSLTSKYGLDLGEKGPIAVHVTSSYHCKHVCQVFLKWMRNYALETKNTL
jgi:hypothetical protein